MSGPTSAHLHAIISQLHCIRNQLARLVKQAVNDDALLALQQHLRVVEQHKHDGVWAGNLSRGQVPEGQAQAQEAFQECVDLVEQLQQAWASATPAGVAAVASVIAPAALSGSSVQNSLAQEDSFMSSVRSSIQAVKTELERESNGGTLSSASILAYQKHLRVIELHKHEGVWGGNLRKGDVPAGQAALNQLFEETTQLADKLAADFN